MNPDRQPQNTTNQYNENLPNQPITNPATIPLPTNPKVSQQSPQAVVAPMLPTNPSQQTLPTVNYDLARKGASRYIKLGTGLIVAGVGATLISFILSAVNHSGSFTLFWYLPILGIFFLLRGLSIRRKIK